MKIGKSLLLGRLGNVQLFTWGYLGFHVFTMVTMRMLLNADTFVGSIAFWLFIFVLEHVGIFTVYWLFKKNHLKQTAATVVVSAMAIGAARTAMTTGIAEFAGLGTNVPWSFQLSSGAIFELFIVLIWAIVNGAYRDHQELVHKLQKARNNILGYRENAEDLLAEEQERLIELTKASVLPQIQLIEQALKLGNKDLAKRLEMANELKGLINNQVRPLSETLRASAKALVTPAPLNSKQLHSVLRIPREFKITNSIFPVFSYILMTLTFIAAPYWTNGQSWVWASAILSVTYFLVLIGAKRATANWPAISAWLAIPLLLLIAALAAAPASIATLIFFPSIEGALLYSSTVTWASIISIATFALLDLLDFGSRGYRTMLTEENKKLELEMALFEQQVWVARKNWSQVLHGTVQGSLTAAITRLNATQVDSDTFRLVIKDLDRAVAALVSPPASRVKLEPALKEVISTWQGVCDITVELPAQVKKTISKDGRISMCLNEIIKEAVSNAVRHGDAKKIHLAVSLTGADSVEIRVSNDGYRPSSALRRGQGTELLDELTLDWTLRFDEKRDQTVLLAHLPFSGSQA